MSQGDTSERTFARIGPDGLAQIGLTRFDVAHVRFENDPEPPERRSEMDPPEDPDPQGGKPGDPDDPENPEDPEDPGFDGEFDAQRARRTIDRLRRERNDAREKAKGAANSPELSSLKAENMRLKVALSTGLDADLADRLRGDTEDELLEDAQKLLDRFYPENKKPEPRQPKPAPRGGARPGAEPELTADDVVKAALAR
ncbi:MAG: hypothetical protein RL430_1901 [Actinomycetota bacterium]